MQDPNIENTVPTRPNPGSGETRPTRVQPDSFDPSSVEATRPVLAHAPAPEPVHSPTPIEPQPAIIQASGSSAAHSAPDDVPTTPVMPINPPPVKPNKKKFAARGPRRWPWILLGILMILLFGGAGSWIGYQSAVRLRQDQLAERTVSIAKEHFMSGLVAQGNKQYEIARKQYEYVIQLDPNFPGAQDKLREVLIAMSIDKTPTPPAPTELPPTLTPTKDTRPQEEIFNSAKQQFANQEWDQLFATIDSLRQIDPKFHAVEVDDMLYIALRYRGINKILHQANLEGGLYDLALAERFGPLDVDAVGYRTWARLYLNGASFWEVDWQKVMQYFEQIYPYFPNMVDSSGITAIERYRIAARSYGDKLRDAGDACGAFDYYEKSLNAVGDETLARTATAVYLVCHPPTPTVTPTPPVTATVAPLPQTPNPTAETPQPPVVKTAEPSPQTTAANP